jgi:hypothetical protein
MRIRTVRRRTSAIATSQAGGATRPGPAPPPGASDYYAYFGANAGPAGAGYYSYNLGAWHIISLNSDTRVPLQGQLAWLQQDLAANSGVKCTLAYWHHPLFSSGQSGNNTHMREHYRVLYDHGVDVLLTGHDHSYERFAEQNPDGMREPNRGIRQFVIGNGGAPWYNFNVVKPNSEQRVNGPGAAGVLKMTLAADTYAWEFITVGRGIQDSGLWGCH